MDDIATFLQRHGWPGWSVAFVVGLAWLIDKLKLWPLRAKSDREILSMDEQSFRVSLTKELESLREEIRKLYGELADSMARHAECERRVAAQAKLYQDTLRRAKASFLDFLLRSADPPPALTKKDTK